MVNYIKTAFPIILLILGIYMMPFIIATFSGSHTLEVSTDIRNLDCVSCHEYVVQEFDYSNSSSLTFEKHAAAANNTNYTTFLKYGYHYNESEGRIYTTNNSSAWDSGAGADPASYIYWEPSLDSWIDNRTGTLDFASVILENNDVPGIQIGELCIFCHSADIFNASTHTNVTVIGCTDIKCHGNSSGTGFGQNFYPTGATGFNLTNDTVHSRWFQAMGNISGPYNYTVHGGSPVNADYFTCIGCHTSINVNLNIIFPPKYMHSNFTTNKIRYL